MSTTPETENHLLHSENHLLRSVLSSVAQGKAGSAEVAFALNETDPALVAYTAYQEKQAAVVEAVRNFLAGGCDDTRPLERAFDKLIEMHGARSADRAAAIGPGKGKRPGRRR